MQIRHSNLLAQARFLQTQAEPKLVRDRIEMASYDCELIESIVLQAVGASSG